MERNSYHSIARMKYEDTNPTEFVDMGYNKEEEEATNTFEMHFIELPKFKQKKQQKKGCEMRKSAAMVTVWL